MSFDGTEGEKITIEEAAEMTADYRAAHPNEIKAHFIGKNIIGKVLNQQGCVGMRVYYGLNASGGREVILVGTDANGDDMLNIIVDRSFPCPNMCSNPNRLNS